MVALPMRRFQTPLSLCDKPNLLADAATALDRLQGPLVHFTSSVIAAVVGTTCHMPFDVVLTMYQSAHSLGGERYNRYGRNGPLGCAFALVQESGPSVLFRGWVPAFVRLVPVSVFSFALYEQLRQLFGIGYLD
eukprot:s3077_g14.t1